MVVNQLKKMVETHDDKEEGIIGTRDDSVNVVAWTEKVWLNNKKAGNITDKVLFLGDISGTDKLIPVLDINLISLVFNMDGQGIKQYFLLILKKCMIRISILILLNSYQNFLFLT